ncbi:MAG: M48 family metallopeptidase [Treponema sp.]|nr:M48 family metallopeptidase [Treponema sp.]
MTEIHLNCTHIFFILYLIGSCLDFGINQWLEYIDFRHRKKYGREIPPEFAAYIDAATVEKTCQYEDARYKYWLPKNILGFVIALALVFSGFYPVLFNNIYSWTQNSFLIALLFTVLSSLPEAIIFLPFRLYREFVIEKRFGFSTMTLRLWIIDQLKGLLVSALLMIPLLFAMIMVLEHWNNWWWLLLGGIYVVFSLAVSLIYPAFIAPLFNKFTPLEDGELKTLLTDALTQTGFKASGLFVMDASKRSKHSNAYFTGFGKTKRVVLYDTLIAQLSPQEIKAVLGHELGHYKHHHITKKLCVMFPLIFAALFLASLFIKNPDLYTAFGFTVEPIPQIQFLGIFLISMVFGGFSTMFSPISNFFSRRDEFQADAFAKNLCGTEKTLTSSLIKLNKENLSELTEPKIYSIFNYSHPPLLERIRALSD